MANTIQIKRSTVASNAPSTGDLSTGELAVNTADKKLYSKHSSGAIITIADGVKLSGIADNANNYSHPSYAGDDIDLDTGALTGATVISDLDFNIATNTNGHVMDANGTVSTRTLTASDIGASSTSHTHSYLPLSGGTLTGSLTIPEYIYHDGDADTSIRFDSDRVRIYAGGDVAFDYDEDSISTLGLSNNGQADISLGGGNVFIGGSQGDFDELVGIGTDTPSSKLHILQTAESYDDGIKIVGSSSPISGRIYMGDANLHIDNATAGANSGITLNSSGMCGIGTTSPDAFCDIVGSAGSKYALRAVNSSSQGWGAYIKGGADSADTSLHVVDKDSDSLFFVRGDGKVSIGAGTSPSQKLHVDGVGQFDSGVKLNGTATTLNDYEQGSWTPTMNSSWTHSGGSTNNRYTKIGNVVTLWGHLSNVASGTSSGNITITGLPFNVSHSATGGTAMLNYVNFNSKASNVSPFVNTSEELYFYETAPGYAWSKMGNADLSSGDDIYFQITYETT